MSKKENNNNNDHISQEELDELLRFSYVETDEFRLYSELTPEQIPLITITGKALGNNAAKLASDVCRRFRRVRGDVLIDLHGCIFLTSLALNVICGLAEQRHRLGSTIIAIGVNAQIHNTMQVMGMDQFFTFVNDRESAIGLYKKSSKISAKKSSRKKNVASKPTAHRKSRK